MVSCFSAGYFLLLPSTLESPTILESHSLHYCHIEFWNNGILYLHLNDNYEVQLEDIIELDALLEQNFNQKAPYCILVNPGRYTSISKEAREYSESNKRNQMTQATAVIVKSLAHRIVINFLINFSHQRAVKMQMFDSKEKAIEWLLSFMS